MATDLTQRPDTVNNQDNLPKPSRVEKITAALTEIEQSGSMPDCVTETPGAFLWEFYKAWVDNGGQDGGKNRNSIRRMRDHWLTDDTEVKSLHPKLTGRIRISKDDAKSLVSLFLGRWKFVGVKEGDWVLTSDGYAPFQCRDCKKLCDTLADAMYPVGSKQARIGLQLPVHTSDVRFEEIQTDWSTVASLYRASDAIINFSRRRSSLGASHPETTKFFWHMFRDFYETMEDHNPIFIWIIDIGSRQVEDEEAWAEFFNFEMLKAQFRSFATFDSIDDEESSDIERDIESDENVHKSGIHDAFLHSLKIPEQSHREKRWKWLCDHTVIIIQNLRKEEFDHLYRDEDVDKIRVKDIGVTAENILPKMLPHHWARHRQLRELYGQNIDNVANATLTAFFKLEGWNDQQAKSKTAANLRYFAHALTSRNISPEKTDVRPMTVSKEIDSPGEFYDEAFRIVYWAARHRLERRKLEQQDVNDVWAIAIAYLKNQGFQVLRLHEFLEVHRSPSG